MKSLGTILLIDDEASIVEFMQEALVDEGYTVISEYDGARAIATAITQQPDLILCDLHMPGVSGVSFVDSIHRDGPTDIPVVMMTADNLAPQRYADKRIAAYLMKPFGLDELLGCVERYMTPSTNGTAAE